MAAALVGINPDLTPPSDEFGPVPQTEELLEDLRGLVHHQPALQKAGYVLWPLSQADLNKKRRCERCTKVIRKGHEKQKSKSLRNLGLAPVNSPRQQPTALANDDAGVSTAPEHVKAPSQPSATSTDEITDALQATTLQQKGPPMNCRFHSGTLQQRKWTCCNNSITSRPCAAEQFHITKEYSPGELESNWRFLTTPPATPSSSSSSSYVAAVVLDCEMGSAESGESELIRVSAVDFFTRRVLVDSLVYPSVKMAHYNTRYSGVSWPVMRDAMRRNKCLRGREAARKALWRFIGPQTIVVGHAGNGDLISLRWIHGMIIDTLLLEMRIQPRDEEAERRKRKEKKSTGESDGPQDGDAVAEANEEPCEAVEAEGPKKPEYPGLSLKALAMARLKREIQVKGKGHDSLEDALATRDLLLWHVINKPVPPAVSVIAAPDES